MQLYWEWKVLYLVCPSTFFTAEADTREMKGNLKGKFLVDTEIVSAAGFWCKNECDFGLVMNYIHSDVHLCQVSL